jgi:RNA polymerase sigma-70 factor (ECF subfamily)
MFIEKSWEPFEIVIKNHYQSIYSLALLWTKDTEDAIDIAQEVFTRAYVGFKTLKDPFKVGAWLRGIAHNVLVDWLRNKKRAEKFQTANDSLSDKMIASSKNNQYRDRETFERIWVVIRALPEDYQMVLTLRYMEALPYSQIAEISGFSVDSVRGIIYRGSKILREKLKLLIE